MGHQVNFYVSADEGGRTLYELDVTTRKHVQFIQQHAPYPVRRLPSSGVVLATHPSSHALAALRRCPMVARYHTVTQDRARLMPYPDLGPRRVRTPQDHAGPCDPGDIGCRPSSSSTRVSPGNDTIRGVPHGDVE